MKAKPKPGIKPQIQSTFDKKLFGSRLQVLRKQIGISQEEFANRIKRSRVAYLGIESGKTASSASLIKDLVNVLEKEGIQVSLDYLFGRTHNQSDSETIRELKASLQRTQDELKHAIEVRDLQKELLNKKPK